MISNGIDMIKISVDTFNESQLTYSALQKQLNPLASIDWVPTHSYHIGNKCVFSRTLPISWSIWFIQKRFCQLPTQFHLYFNSDTMCAKERWDNVSEACCQCLNTNAAGVYLFCCCCYNIGYIVLDNYSLEGENCS